jgi:uncharacterized protein YraI
MFRKSVAAAVFIAGAAFLPGAAQAATAYTVDRAEMRAGPDYDYPTVRVIGDNRRVDIYGCLSDWSFCDVGYRSDRGWVEGDALVVDYRSRRTRIVDAAPYIGIGVLSFSFGSYWDNYYRGRPFYNERGRWERHYNDHYRSNWGPRPGWHGNDRRDNDRRDWNNNDRRGNDRRDWNNNDRRDNDRNGRDNDRRDNRPGASDRPGGYDRPGNNDRPDGRDRNDNDNRTSYRGMPNNPAAAPVQPQTRPGLNERNDDRRGNDRPDARPDRRDAAPAPQVIQPTPTPPAVDNNRNDRPGGGNRPGVGDRQGGGDRQGAGERHDRPQPTQSQERDDRQKPKRAPDTNDDDDRRPGR